MEIDPYVVYCIFLIQCLHAYTISGGKKVKLYGLIHYVNLFGIAIGYTIAASASMMCVTSALDYSFFLRKMNQHVRS